MSSENVRRIVENSTGQSSIMVGTGEILGKDNVSWATLHDNITIW
jgi:hypothetical protein